MPCPHVKLYACALIPTKTTHLSLKIIYNGFASGTSASREVILEPIFDLGIHYSW